VTQRNEYATDIIDQWKATILKFKYFPNLLQILEKFPDILTKFLYEKTANDKDFQKRLYGLIEWSKYAHNKGVTEFASMAITL